MTWEETIQLIRTRPEFQFLVEKAYFEEQLSLNVERFRKSEEYREILSKIKQYAPDAKNILDIGSGNGITAIAFALDGYEVTTVEPDPSNTIGAGAIRSLKAEYRLSNITVHEAFAEEINFEDGSFDIVFARQCMHHAYDLSKFVSEMSRVLKKGGMFFTVRDHVIYDEEDKKRFLENHPLQKYYGGENAFTPAEYREAISNANLYLLEEIKFYDSVINYFPMSKRDFENKKRNMLSRFWERKLMYFFPNYKSRFITRQLSAEEIKVPGRMYSYIATKQ